ncbi:hypothetical protein [Nostoc sp.]|uniref:hypothetical protein n=1 Tax=Nostoc sp. TaxID=1180 RepID=UPI002FF79072
MHLTKLVRSHSSIAVTVNCDSGGASSYHLRSLQERSLLSQVESVNNGAIA